MAGRVDVEELTRLLYAAAPEDFVKQRGDSVRQLKEAGDTEAAAAVGKLPKPSLPAWSVNLLAAQRSDVIDEVVARGDELRAAHSGGGGPKEIRAAQQARQASIRQATRTAVELSGRKVSESHRDEIGATLEAASFDPAAAAEVRAGRLVRPLEAPTGFAPLGGLTVITGGRSGARRSGAGESSDTEAADGATDDQAREARAAMLRAEADAALGDAESAGEAAAEVRDRLAVLDAERARLSDELQRLDKEITDTRSQLRDTERAASDAARKAVRAAARAERADD